MRHFTELPPLSLYVHIPWCVKKCPYCDFNSHQQPDGSLPESEYVDALLSDLEQELPLIWGRQLVSVFIGGGTPSLFSAESIDRLLSGIRALTALSPSIEITMEANPGTFEQARFAGFREAGINRLSIGIQSFDAGSLKALGRIHDGAEALRAVSIARAAGFDNINLDLMYGLPGQSTAQAAADLETAIALSPEHISYYQLTIEPNTLFAHNTPQLPSEEPIWSMQENALTLLAAQGYSRYEVSAFAQPKKQSQHNLNYWLFGDYVGIGAGAHGKISSAASGDILRRWKQRHPRQYLECAAKKTLVGGEQIISEADTGIEFMMNALRLVEGFSIPLFQLNTGTDIYRWQPIINQAIADGLMEQQALQLRPTAKGLDFLNDLLDRFMPEESQTSYPVIRLWED